VIELASGRQTAVAVTSLANGCSVPPGRRRRRHGRDTEAACLPSDSSTGFRLFEFDLPAGTHREVFAGPDLQGNATVSASGLLYYRRLLGPASQPPEFQDAVFIERNLISGTEREITRRFSLGGINLSPDGRHFITGSTSADGTTRSMLLVSVEDGRTREVLTVSRRADSSNPNPIPLAWAADSRSVLLRGRPTPGALIDVWWVPVDGRESRRLVTLPNLGRPGTSGRTTRHLLRKRLRRGA
jgi:hypothetical protein